MSDQQSKDTAKVLATSVHETAADFEGWVKNYPDLIAGSVDPLVRKTASLRRRARKIARACDRPMAVAVYGGSQTGKSYLVSSLAKGNSGGEDKVQVTLDRTYDFLEEINPPGGRESTGLVTRFSITPSNNRPDKPVYLELLSELDIVSIFVNTFYGDLQHKETVELAIEKIEARLLAAETTATASSSTNDHLTADVIIEFREYVERYIDHHGKLRGLVDGVWARLTKVLPKIVTSERVKLYGMLWLDDKDLTKACHSLLGALEKLDFAETATASINALWPRETSIIDVENLAGFAFEGSADIDLESGNGRKTQLGRARLCAITAELYLNLSASPGGVFDYCDLLDFPGARTRLKAESVGAMIKAEESSKSKLDGVSRLYLRGKVDFLFKRYTFNQELAAVLLCMEHGNQEVHELKDTVYDWIATTLGNSPQMRDQQTNTLFVLFTKFDLTIQGKAGGGGAVDTLSTPIKNGLVDFFSHNVRSDNWPSQWDSKSVFKNCHWYRNPFVESALFDYDPDRSDPDRAIFFEIAINSSRKNRIDNLRQAFLDSEEINRYFFTPEKAWDSVMGIQDGGVSHIKERLAATVDSSTKFVQLQGQIEELAGQLKTSMEHYHVSSNAQEQMKKRLEKARVSLNMVVQNVIQRRLFGHLMSRLQLSSADIMYDMQRCLNNLHADGAHQDIDIVIPLGDVPMVQDDIEQVGLVREEQKCADELFERWTSHLNAIIGDERMLQKLQVPPEELQGLVDEIISIAEHQELRAHIAKLIRIHLQEGGQAGRASTSILSLKIADKLNAFTFYLGYDRSAVNGRPKIQIGETQVPVFGRMHEAVGRYEVPKQKEIFNQALYQSWVTALSTRITKAAEQQGGAAINQEANEKLKSYIERIDGVHPTP